MKHTLVGIFNDSQAAGNAVGELKETGHSKDVSVIAKDVNADGLEEHTVKQDMGEKAAKGAGTGAVVGGVLGAIAGGVLAGAASITVPVVGIAAVGPIVAAFTGAGAGATAGSLLGGLTAMGVPENRAKEYEKYVKSGQVLVAVTVEPEQAEKVEAVLNSYLDNQNTHSEGMNNHVERYDYNL